MTKCKNCGGPLVELFMSLACKNECDLRPVEPATFGLEEAVERCWRGEAVECVNVPNKHRLCLRVPLLYLGVDGQWEPPKQLQSAIEMESHRQTFLAWEQRMGGLVTTKWRSVDLPPVQG